jgi:hypothetical protein
MANASNIISLWFERQTFRRRERLLKNISTSMSHLKDQPVERVTSKLAAGLMAACAEDLGLTIVELSGLLRTPKEDAMASLVTVLRDA